jgi:hypothetical protein
LSRLTGERDAANPAIEAELAARREANKQSQGGRGGAAAPNCRLVADAD